MKMFAFLPCTFLLFSFFSVSILTAQDVMPSIREGIRYHDAARDSPEENITKAKEILFPYSKTHALARGYYGSVLTIEAGIEAKNKRGMKALALLDEGGKLIDSAVSMSPDSSADSIELRMLRIINSYEVSQSSPVNRYKVIKTDLDWFENRKGELNPSVRGSLELYTGLYYLKAKKIDLALAAFDTCIKISPESPEALEAAKQKKRYEE